MSRSRRPNKHRSKCGPSGTCDVCNPDMRVKRATVETPEQLASDESFAQIGREVDAVRLAEDARYAMPDAFFAIFGMVRVKG